MTEYTYALTATANSLFNDDRFRLEYTQSAITIAYDHSATGGGNISIFTKAALSAPEKVVLDGLIAAHTGQPLPDPVDSEGRPLVALGGEDNKVQIVSAQGSELRRASHNLCDVLTWYQTGTRITGSQPTVVGGTSNLQWQTINDVSIVDLEHGRLADETGIVADLLTENGHGHLPKVTVSGVVQKRLPPHLESADPAAQDWTGDAAAYDYRIDYTAGRFYFKADPGTAPVVEYTVPGDSRWYLTPDAGKRIDINDVELQWIGTIDFNASFIFEVQADFGGGYVPAKRRIYPSFADIVDDEHGAFPPQDGMDGTPAWRGVGSSETIRHSPMKYLTRLQLQDATPKTRLCLYLGYTWWDENNELQVSVVSAPIGGVRATAMIRALSVDE